MKAIGIVDDEEDEDTAPTVPVVRYSQDDDEGSLEPEPFEIWLEQTRAARSSSISMPGSEWMFRLSIESVPDGVLCSIDGSGNPGRIVTELKDGLMGRKYAVRTWVSDESGDKFLLPYTAYVFLDREGAAEFWLTPDVDLIDARA